MTEFEDFQAYINDGFKQVGASKKLIIDTGFHILFDATKRQSRQIYHVIVNGLQKVAQQEYKYMPDNILEAAIHDCK